MRGPRHRRAGASGGEWALSLADAQNEVLRDTSQARPAAPLGYDGRLPRRKNKRPTPQWGADIPSIHMPKGFARLVALQGAKSPCLCPVWRKARSIIQPEVMQSDLGSQYKSQARVRW